MSQKTVIIDYGMGNVGSIRNMLKHVGADAVISRDRSDVANADKLIFSGVGAFDSGMENLCNTGLLDTIHDRVLEKKTPVLGICLGMQLLSLASEEGTAAGLGWIDARTVRFQFPQPSARLKIPHMGWNTNEIKKTHPLFQDMPEEIRFYFVHSYHLLCVEEDNVLATTHHGYDFVSMIAKDHILGVQFHPEKSHAFGMTLLRNFMRL